MKKSSAGKSKKLHTDSFSKELLSLKTPWTTKIFLFINDHPIQAAIIWFLIDFGETKRNIYWNASFFSTIFESVFLVSLTIWSILIFLRYGFLNYFSIIVLFPFIFIGKILETIFVASEKNDYRLDYKVYTAIEEIINRDYEGNVSLVSKDEKGWTYEISHPIGFLFSSSKIDKQIADMLHVPHEDIFFLEEKSTLSKLFISQNALTKIQYDMDSRFAKNYYEEYLSMILLKKTYSRQTLIKDCNRMYVTVIQLTQKFFNYIRSKM